MANPERLIPLVDFKKEYRQIRENINEALERVLERGWFILGPEGESFEREFANFIGVDHALGVASGTDAITLSLKALGIRERDGVVVPANVYPSAFGVVHSGATLQLVDVDPNTLNMSATALERVVNESTKVVLAVHLYGNPVDMEDISKFCKARGIYLVEDCAQATGAFYKGKRVGSLGDIACFSFYPTKNLGAYGDGGMIVTNNGELANKVRLWRMYGEEARYKSVLAGHNSRLDEMQSAILGAKLEYVDVWNRKRREIAERYRQELSGLPLEIVSDNEEGEPVHHLFVVKAEERDSFANFLKSNGITTAVHYPLPIHLVKSFRYLGYREGDFPISEKASKCVLSLPLYPQMTDEDIEYIIRQVKRYYSN